MPRSTGTDKHRAEIREAQGGGVCLIAQRMLFFGQLGRLEHCPIDEFKYLQQLSTVLYAKWAVFEGKYKCIPERARS